MSTETAPSSRMTWSDVAELLVTDRHKGLLPTALVAATLAALAVATRPAAELTLYLPAALAGAVAVVLDVRIRKIPVVVTRTATTLAALTLPTLAATTDSWPQLGTAALAGAAFALVYFALVYIPTLLGRPSLIGAGDARLAGYLGLLVGWLGSRGIEALAIVPYLTGALEVVGRALARRRERAVAFGPHLVAGLAVALWLTAGV